MNYAYLLRKFTGISAIVHDRTWDGLEMPKGSPIDKPSLLQFEGWQEEEDRLARAEGKVIADREKLVELKHSQARAKALEEIRPFEDKLREKEREEFEACLRVTKEAIECKSALRVRSQLLEAWKPITEAQILINEESQRYLDATALYMSWDRERVPEEILKNRKLAHDRISDGDLIFQDYRSLRERELPSRAEIDDAIRRGGEHLERIKKVCKDVCLKYPKHKRSY